MRRMFAIALAALLVLSGCSNANVPAQTSGPTQDISQTLPIPEEASTVITLLGDRMQVEGENAIGVYAANDIVYYEDRDTYPSGNPYGEGEAHERHSAEEAAAHLVVHITKPGAYRLSGTLTQGQIAVDLGEDAYEDPNAVVTLILDNVDITCTVAPAIVFYNVYECDGNWSTETAKAEVDTAAAGANLILASGSQNTVNGSHVARIYKDKEGEKKLWKMDGAIYSFMSMNLSGNGMMDLYADNEGLDTELHLTINGGDINIRSDNDGINTNEDGVSVTTINGGNLHIIAGLGEEGDGIDSNGYLVINGGTVVASANPAADAGLDSDLGSYIHGGTVIALGSAMDWAESDSEQVTMNLQFASFQSSSSSIAVTKEDGSFVFAYDPGKDAVLGENARRYQGTILSCGAFAVGEGYEVLIGGEITGTEKNGIYQSVSACEGGVQQAYTGTDVMMRPGGFGGGRNPGGMGQPPEGGEMPTMPEGMEGQPPEPPEGMDGERPEPPGGMEGEMPTMPEGEMPGGKFPGQGGMQPGTDGESQTLFYMQDKVNFFSGLLPAETK